MKQNSPYFSIERDKTYPFFCEACIVGKPETEISQDSRYCQVCYDFLLKEAKNVKKILTDDTYNLATSIKGFGDITIHREEEIEPEEAKLVIYATVRMLNELFKET